MCSIPSSQRQEEPSSSQHHHQEEEFFSYSSSSGGASTTPRGEGDPFSSHYFSSFLKEGEETSSVSGASDAESGSSSLGQESNEAVDPFDLSGGGSLLLSDASLQNLFFPSTAASASLLETQNHSLVAPQQPSTSSLQLQEQTCLSIQNLQRSDDNNTTSNNLNWKTHFTCVTRHNQDLFSVHWKPRRKPKTSLFTEEVYATHKYTFHVELRTREPISDPLLLQIHLMESAPNENTDHSKHISGCTKVLLTPHAVGSSTKGVGGHSRTATTPTLYRGTLKVALKGNKLSSYLHKGRKYHWKISLHQEKQPPVTVLESSSCSFKIFSRTPNNNSNKTSAHSNKRKRKEGSSTGSSDTTHNASQQARKRPRRVPQASGANNTDPTSLLQQFSQSLDEIFELLERCPRETRPTARDLLIEAQAKIVCDSK